jgi:tRNA pseudouridine(55) synthase
MIEVYKKKYQTCLEMLAELRKDDDVLRDETLSYNGILDPMAEGIVPVLVGDDENKNRDKFTGSVKEYEVEVLVGVSTDSGDLLGVVGEQHKSQKIKDERLSAEISKAFVDFPREFEQTVPMHSNRKVRGKRLWWWMLHGEIIPESERPTNNVKILDLEMLPSRIIIKNDLVNEIETMNANIGERFRLKLVYDSWQEYFNNSSEIEDYQILKFRIKVSSGFYVRTFIESVSKITGVPMLMYSLKRTKVIFNSN